MIDYTLKSVYQVAGLSKQAVHQYRRRQEQLAISLEELLGKVDEVRREHPGCGLEKLYYTLQPDFLGRDRFIELLQSLGYGLKKRQLRPRTTTAGPLRFANLIEGRTFSGPNQVWQSDITYFDLGDRFAYIVFLIDIYSKVIVGHQVSDHLQAQANLKALRRAVRRFGPPLIHHSDRGSQYGSHAYLNFLRSCKVQVSMAAKGPDNAYAERINGTIKNEYLQHWEILNLSVLKRRTAQAIKHYNYQRPHNHLNRKQPMTFLNNYDQMEKEQRPLVHVPILNY